MYDSYGVKFVSRYILCGVFQHIPVITNCKWKFQYVLHISAVSKTEFIDTPANVHSYTFTLLYTYLTTFKQKYIETVELHLKSLDELPRIFSYQIIVVTSRASTEGKRLQSVLLVFEISMRTVVCSELWIAVMLNILMPHQAEELET